MYTNSRTSSCTNPFSTDTLDASSSSGDVATSMRSNREAGAGRARRPDSQEAAAAGQQGPSTTGARGKAGPRRERDRGR